MDVKFAAQRTTSAHVRAINLARDSALPKAKVAHLLWMNAKIQAEEVPGDVAQRWLGWMQAVVYLQGAASHEDLLRINLESDALCAAPEH